MKIDQSAAAFLGDAAHGSIDGLAASAPGGPENISNQAMGVHAHQHGLIAGVLAIALDVPFDISFNKGDVRVTIDFRLVHNHAEFAVGSGDGGLGHATHVALVGHSVADEFRDSEHLQ